MAMHREAWITEADELYGPGGDHGGSEAHWAAFAGDVDSLRELEPHLLEKTDGLAPAHWAAIGNRVAALQYLHALVPGAMDCLEAKDEDGSTPAHAA